MSAHNNLSEPLALDFEEPAEQMIGLDKSSESAFAKGGDGGSGPDDARGLFTSLAYLKDEAELLALFKMAFGHDMPSALWRWKYQGLTVIGTLVRREGQVVAFYGGMPRAVLFFGSPTTSMQIGDVMVHPKLRGILTRKGPFFHVTVSFLEQFVGYGKPFPIAFGFPSERHVRLGMRLGLYDKVGELMQINWPALKALPDIRVSLKPLSASDHDVADRLWTTMASTLQDQIVGVRDSAYLQHRYFQHPTLSYQLHLAYSRLTGRPIGIIVIRVLDEAIELVDIIAPPKAVASLVACLRRLTAQLGKAQAYTWITAQHTNLFVGTTGTVTPTGISIPTNSWTPGIPADELANRWWLMAGDTDFR